MNASVIQPQAFAEEWCAGWNAHDVERVLSHFRDDVIFMSPVAAQMLPDTGGRLVGKEQLRSYWNEALKRVPELRFELRSVFAGVGCIVIAYQNQRGVAACEVLQVEDGLVTVGSATYEPTARDPAGLCMTIK